MKIKFKKEFGFDPENTDKAGAHRALYRALQCVEVLKADVETQKLLAERNVKDSILLDFFLRRCDATQRLIDQLTRHAIKLGQFIKANGWEA